MNYLSTLAAYIIGMFVPYITSTAVILGINKKNIDRTTRLSIFRTNALIEGSSVVMAYYGITSSKSSISIEMDQFSEIEDSLLWTLLITIGLIILIYLFAIQVYISLPKGVMYKALGAGYLITYIYISTNLLTTLAMICISLLSMYLLKATPAISRSLSFLLTSIVK